MRRNLCLCFAVLVSADGAEATVGFGAFVEGAEGNGIEDGEIPSSLHHSLDDFSFA